MKEEINEGDLVICVDDSPMKDGTLSGLIKGNKYVVSLLFKCVRCGVTAVCVGIPEIGDISVTCYCGCPLPKNLERTFKNKRFRKIEPAKEIRVVSIASDLRKEVRELVNDVLVKERRDV